MKTIISGVASVTGTDWTPEIHPQEPGVTPASLVWVSGSTEQGELGSSGGLCGFILV